MAKHEYEPIPDVEAPPIKDKHELTLQEKYPEANETELRLLGLLDEVIDNSTPSFDPPLLSVADVGPPLSITEFILSLKLPTAALVACVVAAAVVVIESSPVYIAMYPYLSCVLTFISSIPAMTARFNEQASRIFDKIDTTQQEVTSKVDGISSKAIESVDQVEKSINDIIEPMRPKLDQASKMEDMLKTISPDVDIPDPSDIERELDGVSDKLTSPFEAVKKAVDMVKRIPRPLQSKKKFDTYVVYPTLAVFLVLQLLGVFTAQSLKSEEEDGSAVDEVSANLTRMLEYASNATDYATNATVDMTNQTLTNETIVNQTLTNQTVPILAPTTFAETSTEQWHLVVQAVQAYVQTVIQLIITFLATQAAAIAKALNKMIISFTDDVNKILDEKVGPVFHDVLCVKMEKIKTNVLNLIQQMEKLEGPLSKLPKTPNVDLSAVTRSLPVGMKPPNVDLSDVSKSVPVGVPSSIPTPKVEVPEVKVPSTKGFGRMSKKMFGK